MKLWIGAEIEASIGDSFRNARMVVVNEINFLFLGKEYNVLINDLDCVAIIRSDDEFDEIVSLNRSKMDMDFRLKIDFCEFYYGDHKKKESLIFNMVKRSLFILRDEYLINGVDALISDIEALGTAHGW